MQFQSFSIAMGGSITQREERSASKLSITQRAVTLYHSARGPLLVPDPHLSTHNIDTPLCQREGVNTWIQNTSQTVVLQKILKPPKGSR